MARQTRSTNPATPLQAAATPKALPRIKDIVPAPGGPDESVSSTAEQRHAKAGTAFSTPVRTKKMAATWAPTTAEVTSIPTEHLTPSIAPSDEVEATSLRVPALAVLGNMMKGRLSASEFAKYEGMISHLTRRGARETAIRKRYHPELVDFFKIHPDEIPVHDSFAKMYNKQFERKHERYHLPVYGESLVGHAVQENESAKLIGKRKRSDSLETCGESIITTSTAAFPSQMDGAMDFNRDDASRGTVPSASVSHSGVPSSSPESQHSNPKAKRMTVVNEDTEMLDAAPKETDAEALSEGFQELQPDQEDETRTTPGSSIAQRLTSPDAPENMASTVLETSNDSPNAAAMPMPPAPESDSPGEPSAAHADSEMIDDVVETVEEIIEDSAEPTAPPKQPHPESARSYLAWLHHRQTRFPTVGPKYAECTIIAKELGRAPSRVLDEALYHWGFETANDHGEWYKQNRLEVLGEDPRFDEETMDWWEAWLEKGVDEQRERERRKRR